jgi:hypothetical protein
LSSKPFEHSEEHFSSAIRSAPSYLDPNAKGHFPEPANPIGHLFAPPEKPNGQTFVVSRPSTGEAASARGVSAELTEAGWRDVVGAVVGAVAAEGVLEP